MTQIVASQSYYQNNSNQLARTGSQSFGRTDGSVGPTSPIIDKHQARRLYHLQRPPNVNTSLYLDSTDTGYGTQGYFENIVGKQVNGSSVQPVRTVYYRPTDMSNKSMGKGPLDTQRISPSEIATGGNHPTVKTTLRDEESYNNADTSCLTDRSVSDRIIRSQLDFSDKLFSEQAGNSFRHHSSQPDLTYNSPKQQESTRHVIHPSIQQDPRSSLTTYEANGSDPNIKSPSFTSLHDGRTRDVLKWDRVQLRHNHYDQKPISNIAPLPRAQQKSGYSGSIGGYNLQDIDNPTIDFQPYTVLRTEQPKFSMNSSKSNMLSYTGNTLWTKVDPVSHYDQYGDAYTTTAAVHRPLPIDNSSYRHSGMYGLFSKSVTNVMPKNPYNRMDNSSETTNGSLDSRPHLVLRHLPRTKLPPPIKNVKKEEQNVEK